MKTKTKKTSPVYFKKNDDDDEGVIHQLMSECLSGAVWSSFEILPRF